MPANLGIAAPTVLVQKKEKRDKRTKLVVEQIADILLAIKKRIRD